ncbi:MAG: agarase, partial [Blastocatellia bacterium]
MKTRRRFLKRFAALGAGLSALSRRAAMPPPEAKGFFTVGQRGGRWWLFTPEGRPFFSVALNHIDSSPLRYVEAGDVWARKYGNSTERWLKQAVRRDLLDWGFNSVGWTQEDVVRGDKTHRHSPPFTFEEYQWLGLPYCHLLPFSEIHQWEDETRHPDFFSKDFADWCDYVARSHCARMAGDAKLIGYFYSDCPMWVHTRPTNQWKGPLFDPEKLRTEAGRKELFDLATRYYRITHDAIRRYDKRHLILGDRYEANAPLPLEVVEAARPFVDVLCFQDFKDPVKSLGDWHRRTGKPVLWADGARNVPAKDPVTGASFVRNGGQWYADVLRGVRDNPG